MKNILNPASLAALTLFLLCANGYAAHNDYRALLRHDYDLRRTGLRNGYEADRDAMDYSYHRERDALTSAKRHVARIDCHKTRRIRLAALNRDLADLTHDHHARKRELTKRYHADKRALRRSYELSLRTAARPHVHAPAFAPAIRHPKNCDCTHCVPTPAPVPVVPAPTGFVAPIYEDVGYYGHPTGDSRFDWAGLVLSLLNNRVR